MNEYPYPHFKFRANMANIMETSGIQFRTNLDNAQQTAPVLPAAPRQILISHPQEGGGGVVEFRTANIQVSETAPLQTTTTVGGAVEHLAQKSQPPSLGTGIELINNQAVIKFDPRPDLANQQVYVICWASCQ